MRFLLILIFIPLRGIWIISITLFMGLIYLFSSRKKFPRSRFLKNLFEKLGGSFIKMGQGLSMRMDYVSKETAESLGELLDKVKPFSAARGIRIIQRTFRKPINELFEYIDSVPVASASFSQVYKAKTLDGQWVAVKVQRPGIYILIAADVFFIKTMGWFMGITPVGRRLRVRSLTHEMGEVLYQELDYERESSCLQVCRNNASGISWFFVPAVFENLSSRNVLTMQFVEGKSLREILSMVRAGNGDKIKDSDGKPVDLVNFGEKIYQASMKAIFEFGFFHGDPHPGNIFLLKDGKISFVDYGICGYMSHEDRELNLSYIGCLTTSRFDEAAEIYTRIVLPNKAADQAGLKCDMMLLLQKWRKETSDIHSSYSRKSAGVILDKSVQLARKYNFHLPMNVLLYYKTVILIDHINLELNPSYDSIGNAERFLRNLYFSKFMELGKKENIYAMSQSVMMVLERALRFKN